MNCCLPHPTMLRVCSQEFFLEVLKVPNGMPGVEPRSAVFKASKHVNFMHYFSRPFLEYRIFIGHIDGNTNEKINLLAI